MRIHRYLPRVGGELELQDLTGVEAVGTGE
jgi:hypothetical protein